jgi:hypothetical protein
MTKVNKDRLIVECACGNPDHLLVFDYYKDELEPTFIQDEIDVSFTSKYYDSFLKRLRIGLKYIFRGKTFMSSDCVMFNHRNISDLEDMIVYLKQRVDNHITKEAEKLIKEG